MVRSSRLLLSAAVCGIIGFGAVQVHAADVDVAATLNASPALTIAPAVDMDFASVDFAAIHSGDIQLGPDGNAALIAPTGLTLSGTPVAGQISITESAETLEVSCDATATIGDGTTDLTISAVVFDTGPALAPVAGNFGAAANTCGGLGVGPVVIDTTTVNDPVINIGAQVDIGANVLNASGSSTYDTATGGGDPITFRIVVQ